MWRALVTAAAMLTCSSMGASDLEVQNLRGPVHTVTIQYFAFPDNAPEGAEGAPGRVMTDTYDLKGFKFGEEWREADGSLVHRTITERDGWRPLRIITYFPDPADDRVSVYLWGDDGALREISDHDARGCLRFRRVVRAPDSDEEITYREDGSIETRVVNRWDRKNGRTVQELYQGNKLERTLVADWPRDDSPGTDSVYAPDGRVLSRRATAQASGRKLQVESSIWSGRPVERREVFDDMGRYLEMIEEGPGEQYVKVTYHYNPHGDQAEIANYDRDGSLQRKVVSEYEYDAWGNWILQTDFVILPASTQRYPVSKAVRTITYY